jgi:hypothetical protein
VPADDSAAGGAITAFLTDVSREYEEAFFERLEWICDRKAPVWGQRDPWGEAIRAGSPLVAMASPAFAADAARVAEVIGLSGTNPDDPSGRVVLLPWERVEEPGEEAIPTINLIEAGSEQYADAVWGVAFWVRGVIEVLTEQRPAETEWSRQDTAGIPHHPLSRDVAFEARQYSRLSAQILHNAAILDTVSMSIFDGFERVLGSNWTELDVPGAGELAVDLSPRVAESKIASKTMIRSWKEALRILRHIHQLCEEADYHPFREPLKAKLRDLAEALDVQVDVQTLTELQFGAEAKGDLRPAFRALMRNASVRQRVRAGALACLAAVGETVPGLGGLIDPDILRPRHRKSKDKSAKSKSAKPKDS